MVRYFLDFCWLCEKPMKSREKSIGPCGFAANFLKTTLFFQSLTHWFLTIRLLHVKSRKSSFPFGFLQLLRHMVDQVFHIRHLIIVHSKCSVKFSGFPCKSCYFVLFSLYLLLVEQIFYHLPCVLFRYVVHAIKVLSLFELTLVLKAGLVVFLLSAFYIRFLFSFNHVIVYFSLPCDLLRVPNCEFTFINGVNFAGMQTINWTAANHCNALTRCDLFGCFDLMLQVYKPLSFHYNFS